MNHDAGIEWVPDAAAPEAFEPRGEIEFDSWRDASDSAPVRRTYDVAAEIDAARTALVRHLERVERRRDRRRQRPQDGHRIRLADARFCVIDLETTGPGVGCDDEILEIGAVQVAQGELGHELSTLVDPQRPVSAAARAVHGIRDEDLAGAPRLATVLPFLLEMTRDRVLVFHNSGFDLGFIQRALDEHDRERMAQPLVDTLPASRLLLGGRCGLGHVGQRLGIDAPHLHRGLPDARLTALVLLRFMALFEEVGGTWLDEMPGFVARPARSRRRRAPNVRWLGLLTPAIRSRAVLEIVYRVGAGTEPFTVCIRPLEIRAGMQLVAEDLSLERPCILDLQRIERLRPA